MFRTIGGWWADYVDSDNSLHDSNDDSLSNFEDFKKPCMLSDEMADVIGIKIINRHNLVKTFCSMFMERNMYDPKNRNFVICDDQMKKLFGVNRFRILKLFHFLKPHIIHEID